MFLQTTIFRIYTLILAVFILFSPREAFSYDQVGKVINVNYQKQVAYTDLGNRVLAIGDMVRIGVADGEQVILKVTGTSDQFSKLRPDKNSKAEDPAIFKAVKVGDDVSRAIAMTAQQWSKVSPKSEINSRTSYSATENNLVDDMQNIVNSSYANRPQQGQQNQAIDEGFKPVTIKQDNQVQINELNDYKVKYRQLQGKYDELKFSLMQKSEEKDSDLAQMKEQLIQYQDEQQLLNKKMQDLLTDLESAEKKNRSFEDRIKQSEVEKSALNKKVNQLTGEVDRLQKKNLERENEINELKATNEQLKVKMNSIVNLIDQNI